MIDRKSEIFAVKELGEKIGYGNMMDLASALWSITLEDNYEITSGAFFPTLINLIKDKEQKQCMEELNRNKELIRDELK